MDSNEPTEQEPGEARSYTENKRTYREATGNHEERTLDAADGEIDTLLTALKNPRRRGVIQLLDDHGALSIDILTQQLAAREVDCDPEAVPSDARKRVYVSLYQTHLPRLDDANIIDTDDYSRGAAPGTAFNAARDVLEAVDAIQDGHAVEIATDDDDVRPPRSLTDKLGEVFSR